MSKTILVVSNVDIYKDDIIKEITRDYDIIECRYDKEQLMNINQNNDIDLMIVYLRHLDKEQVGVVDVACRINRYMPIILIGGKFEIDSVDEIIQRPIEERLVLPISGADLKDAVSRFFVNDKMGNTQIATQPIRTTNVAPAASAASDDSPASEKSLIDELLGGLDERKSILVIDDNNQYLRMLNNWLSADYKVTICSSGTDALVYLSKNKVDLILLDYEMPTMDGASVLAKIKSNKKMASIPVMFLTAVTDKERIIKALSLGPKGYILKTETKADILNRLRMHFTFGD